MLSLAVAASVAERGAPNHVPFHRPPFSIQLRSATLSPMVYRHAGWLSRTATCGQRTTPLASWRVDHQKVIPTASKQSVISSLFRILHSVVAQARSM